MLASATRQRLTKTLTLRAVALADASEQVSAKADPAENAVAVAVN